MIGYRIRTKHTVYVMTLEEGGAHWVRAEEFRPGSAAEHFNKAPSRVIPWSWPPVAGDGHFGFTRAGPEHWPENYNNYSSVQVTRIQEVTPLEEGFAWPA